MGYNVGLDIGVGSVGWAVIDDNYRLVHKKGKNLIGVHLFEGAMTAEERRGYRTTRRRLARRRWRLGFFNQIFAPALLEYTDDQNFLRRLQYSWVHPDDEAMRDNWYQGSLFGNVEADKKFYQDYPTIYHLRLALMHDDKQHDLREVYLAMHHIMKYRGNFLLEADHLDLDAVFDVAEFAAALQNLNTAYTITDTDAFVTALTNVHASRTARVEGAREFLDGGITDAKEFKKISKEILNALVGLNINFATMFMREVDKDEAKAWKLNFNSADIDEQLAVISELLADDSLTTFINKLKQAYDGLTLQMLLKDQKSLSAAMVKSYETHKANWEFIKENGRNATNKHAVNDAYQQLLSDNQDEHDKGLKAILAALKGHLDDSQLADFELADSTNNFLPRQRTKENGTIPVQLHDAELKAIIAKQGQYYPFLNATFTDEDGAVRNKLVALLRFRVPYYVGPMVSGQNPQGRDEHNHWMVRKTQAPITPWNFKQVVDTDQSAQKFIKAMISTDTYLMGEPALAKHTLAYEQYNVLQELNNVRLNGRRLDVNTKQAIFEEVFKQNSHVTLADVGEFLRSKYGNDGELTGLADKNKFNSNLSSYHYLKHILGANFVDDAHNGAVLDEIITLQTVFEDSEILTRQLGMLPQLSANQVASLAKKHFTGWGKLSAKLLQTRFIKATNTSVERVSIMDLLYTTSKNLMEIMNDEQFGVQDWITKQNMHQDATQSIDDLIDQLAGPRNIKRSIKKSFNILLDIQKIMGAAPSKIYLEFARDTQASRQTRSRFNALKRLYDNPALKSEFKAISGEFKQENDQRLQNDRLYLYYTQLGRDFYTGQPINIDRLADYDIDHIIPQAYIKDNSIDNRVLVNRAANNRKSDGNLSAELINHCRGMWEQAQRHGLISEKKLKRLKGEMNLENNTERFIARQLVETRQIIKNVAVLAKQLFPDDVTTVQAVRAEMTSDMRKKLNIVKNRDVNDYHHAFDALLMATVGIYMERRGIMQAGKVADNAGNEFNIYAKQYLKRLRQEAAETGRQIKPLGFVIDGMFSDDVAKRVNRDSGEVVFDNIEDVNYLRHVLAFKKILLTRPTKIGSGQLYKETQFKNPRNDVKKRGSLIPVKGNKPTELYGGFSASTSAYMTLVRVESKKDSKNVLVKIPMAVHKLIESKQLTLETYIRDVKQIKNFARIIIPIVKLDQLVEDNGERFYLTSSEYRHNAESIWMPSELVNKLKHILNDQDATAEEILSVFEALTNEQVQRRLPIFASHLQRIVNLQEPFENLDLAVQQEFLLNLLYVLHNNNGFRAVIKKAFKKEIEWPNLQSQDNGQGGIKLSDDAVFIYQSPTGIFEKRVSVRDLL